MKKLLPLLALLTTLFTAHAAENSHVLVSPHGKLTLTLWHTAEDGLRFAFEADGRELMRPSPIGHAAGGAPVTGTWAGIATRSVDEVWKPLWGKRAAVPDRFNEVTVDLTDFKVEARVYDEGIALRSGRPDARGLAERTRFEFAGDYTAWFYNGEQPNIGPEKLSASTGLRRPVMTVKAAEGAYLAIHEADLAEGDPLVLESKAGETAFRVASAPNNAWRVILFGRTPGAMVDSHLIELLNPPPADGADFSWVKPGVAVWDWRINGAEAGGFRYDMSLPSWIRMVDFAAENGIGQLVLDADWYGPEHESQSDPVKGGKVGQVKRILAYGQEKGVGVWLYLNDVAGRQFPLEETLRQYSEWGAVGIKYGFMRGSATERNARTRLITERAAAHRLMVNFHDNPVHPYGQMRTFPNAVTREYCHSQLDAHRVYQPKTFVTSVFVNMLAGPIDMCNGLADLTQAKRVDEPSPVPSTLAGEGARTLIVFSGSTVIPDIPENYRKHPEILEFISAQKMPWRDSRTLGGVIGEHIVMARQAADGVWLVGAATNEEPRELKVPLDFLTPGTFEALIIQDGPDADYRTHVESYRAETRQVIATDRITLKLAPGGGACVLLRAAR